MTVAMLLVAALAAITGLHLLWATGRTWPATDEAELVRLVIGDPKLRSMPPRPITAAVAVALTATMVTAGLLPLHVAGWLDGPVTLAGAAIGTVFLVRGLATYTAPWRRGHPLEPFATRDRWLYGPSSIALGVGFLHLVTTRI